MRELRISLIGSSALVLMLGCGGEGGPGHGADGNLFNDTFEDGTYGGLTLTNPQFISIPTGGAFSGLRYMDLNIPDSTNDSGARGDVDLGGASDHVYIVYAMRITTTPSQGLATQKTTIFRNGGNAPNQFGEMNQIDGRLIWNWLFTDPNKGNIDLTAFGDISAILGQWHTYKLELDSRGPGTKVVFGRDGVDHMITLTTTNAPAGLPDAISVGGTLNGGSGPSHVEFDDIHVGTVDPGWP